MDAFTDSNTALAAVKREAAAEACTVAALSPAARKRDLYLDRLAEMSEDELAEMRFAAEVLS